MGGGMPRECSVSSWLCVAFCDIKRFTKKKNNGSVFKGEFKGKIQNLKWGFGQWLSQ